MQSTIFYSDGTGATNKMWTTINDPILEQVIDVGYFGQGQGRNYTPGDGLVCTEGLCTIPLSPNFVHTGTYSDNSTFNTSIYPGLFQWEYPPTDNDKIEDMTGFEDVSGFTTLKLAGNKIKNTHFIRKTRGGQTGGAGILNIDLSNNNIGGLNSGYNQVNCLGTPDAQTVSTNPNQKIWGGSAWFGHTDELQSLKLGNDPGYGGPNDILGNMIGLTSLGEYIDNQGNLIFLEIYGNQRRMRQNIGDSAGANINTGFGLKKWQGEFPSLENWLSRFGHPYEANAGISGTGYVPGMWLGIKP